MAEQQTGVRVTHLVGGTISRPEVADYPSATRITVNEGRLVLGDGSKNVAVYGQEMWLRAEAIEAIE